MDEQEDTTIYKVVINHEEQYSIWPAERENPLGWSDAGKSGTGNGTVTPTATPPPKPKPSVPGQPRRVKRNRGTKR